MNSLRKNHYRAQFTLTRGSHVHQQKRKYFFQGKSQFRASGL